MTITSLFPTFTQSCDHHINIYVREEGKNKNAKKEKVRLHLRLDHQVQFGDHVVVLGSAKELGSWKKNVPLNWTQNGWVCDLELNGGDHIEFKFVIVNKDASLVWEAGENRVLKLPASGHFETVARWNTTDENMGLLPLDGEKEDKNFGDNNESHEKAAAPLLEAEPSPFVGQWQGRTVSFMRSNEHHGHETERKGDTSGLQGLPLKLVQGDQNSRNWWRKVLLLIMLENM